jgi:hypothetical protein
MASRNCENVAQICIIKFGHGPRRTHALWQNCALDPDGLTTRTRLRSAPTPGDRSAIELVYPGVHHSFDQLDLSLAPTRGITIKEHRAEFNEEATKDSIVRVRDFLQRTIGGQ